MKRFRQGFTLVEVALFLAITGILFIGIVAGVQNSMFQQRYNDSVQSFAEFLRSIYSQTSNVQNPNTPGGGRSINRAIYGRLVVFGETKDLDGNNAKDGAIYAYDLIGNVGGSFPSNTLEALKSLNLTVMDDEGDFAGNVDEYKPRWGASIQPTDKFENFKGAIMVVRHPRSGSISTFVKTNGTIEINRDKTSITSEKLLEGFDITEVDFCINPNGDQRSDARRDIRIIKGARNASGVEIIELDSSAEKDGEPNNINAGNRCNNIK